MASSVLDNNISNTSNTSTIYLLRHGDRYDFANPVTWKEKVKKCGGLTVDPPLSSLGHEQARETAKNCFSSVNINAILVSPYLRTIQTAVPFSELKGVPICIEPGLAEGWHCPNLLPTTSERYRYFPHIDIDYEALHITQASEGHKHPFYDVPQEKFPDDYFRRFIEFAGKLDTFSRNKTVVCFSHAASVALVAALLKCNLDEIPCDALCESSFSEKYQCVRYDLFAPVGIYKLTKKDEFSPWVLEKNGSTNNHCTKTSPGTYPWGHRVTDYGIWKKIAEDGRKR